VDTNGLFDGVSIQLVSPASGDTGRTLQDGACFGKFPFN